MSYHSELKITYLDNKFIFYPVLMLLLAGIVLEHFFGLNPTILVLLPFVLLILLVAIFHTYRATMVLPHLVCLLVA